MSSEYIPPQPKIGRSRNERNCQMTHDNHRQRLRGRRGNNGIYWTLALFLAVLPQPVTGAEPPIPRMDPMVPAADAVSVSTADTMLRRTYLDWSMLEDADSILAMPPSDLAVYVKSCPTSTDTTWRLEWTVDPDDLNRQLPNSGPLAEVYKNYTIRAQGEPTLGYQVPLSESYYEARANPNLPDTGIRSASDFALVHAYPKNNDPADPEITILRVEKAQFQSAPANLAAPTRTTRTGSQIVITWPWDAANNDRWADIKFYIARKAGNAAWELAYDSVTTVSYTDTGIDAATTYQYKVAVRTSCRQNLKEADYSDLLEVTPAPAAVPGPPTSVSAVETTRTSAITVRWQAPAVGDVTAYKIERNPQPNGTGWGDLHTTTDESVLSHEDTDDIEPGTAYRYRVYALNGASSSTAAPNDQGVAASTTPDPPTGVAVTESSPGTVSVTWDAPSEGGVENYVVERYLVGENRWRDIHTTTSATPRSFTDTRVRPTATYRYRVASVFQGQTGAFEPPAGQAVTITGGRTANNVPTNVRATAAGPTSVLVQWDLPTMGDWVGFLVLVRAGSSGEFNLFVNSPVLDPKATSSTVTGLTPATAYEFKVLPAPRTANLESDVVRATTLANTPEPGAVRNLEARLGTLTVNLSWDAPSYAGTSAISKYVVLRGTSSPPTDVVAETQPDETEFTENLGAGQVFYYAVVAENASGRGPLSEIKRVQRAGDAPASPRAVTASLNSDATGIIVTWQAPESSGSSAIARYDVYGGTANPPTTKIGDTRGNVRIFNYANVQSGTTYHFRIKAVNEDGHASVFSAVASRTVTRGDDNPGSGGQPSVPRSLRATASGTSVILTWQAPASRGNSAITGYRLERSDNGTTWQALASLGASALTYTHTSVPSGRRLYYRVIAINAQGESRPSATAQVTTAAARPSAPRNLSAVASGTMVDLSWEAPASDGGAAITGYRISYAVGVGGSWDVLVANTGTTTTTYTHSNRKPGERIRYRVSAINSAGAGPESGVAEAVIQARVPGSPTAVTATAGDDRSVTIDWSPPANDGGSPVTSYQIEFSTDQASWRILAAEIAPTSRRYKHTRLEPAATYYYRVYARNDVGFSPPSQVAEAVTAADAPDAPVALTASASGVRQIDLSWRAPEYTGGVPILGYRIEYSADGVSWHEVADHVETEFYSHMGLTPATTYYYRVYTRNRVGLSVASGVVRAETTADVPGQPTDLGAIAASRNEILLGWSPPRDDGGSPIIGYKIESSTDGGASWTTVRSNTGTTNTAYRHGNLQPGTMYRYRVSAVNEVGAGEPSEYAEARTHGPPSAPASLFAEAVSPSQINLRWSEPDHDGGLSVTGYLIEYSDDGGGAWEVAAETTTETTYAHRGLRSGTAYHYRVRAINGIGVGAASQQAEATTLADVPDPPRGLTAAASAHDRIELRWQAPGHDGGARITGYLIEVSSDGGASWLVVEDHVQDLRHTHGGLAPATTYTYRVSAVNEVGTSQPSNPSEATTLATAPTRPRDLKAEAAGSDQVDLQWIQPERDGGAAVTGYQIQVSEDGGGSWQLVSENTGTNKLAYEHTGLKPGSEYRYRVAAINEMGRGEWSREAEARTDAVVPEAPLNLKATIAAFDRIDLAWEPPGYDGGAPVTKYVIDARAGDGRDWELLAEVDGLAYAHTGATPGVLWSYRVSAVNEAGMGPASEAASARLDDPVQRADRVSEAIMPWFGASAASSAVRSISARVGAVARGTGPEGQVNLQNGRDGLRGLANGASVSRANSGLTVWATADLTGLSNGGTVEWSGETFSVHGGLDGMLRRDFLVGLAANRTTGDFDFTDRMHGREIEGLYEAEVTSMTPYAAWVGDDVNVWTAYGKGWGSVMVTDSLAGTRQSRLATTTAALGGMKRLASSAIGAFGLRAEAWTSSVEIAGNVPEYLESGREAGHVNESAFTMRRARLMLDWSVFDGSIGAGQTEVVFRSGMRQDWNNIQKGLGGAEVGGELRFESSIFRVRGDGRVFAHSQYREWGVRGMIELRSQREQGGLSLQVNPAYGSAGGGVQQLWESGVGNTGTEARHRKARVDVVAGYRPAGSPLASFGRYDSVTEQFKLGTRLHSALDWTVESGYGRAGLGLSIRAARKF